VVLARALLRADALDAAERLVKRTTRLTQNRAKVLSPVDTGRLRSEIKVKIFRRRRAVVGWVYANVDYGLPVHEGWSRTKPILPTKGKALKFKIGGKTVIVKAVYTPASAAGRPFLTTALLQVAPGQGFVVSL
jgi:hypothetical protein